MEKNGDFVFISPSEFHDTPGTCSNTAKPCLQGIKNFFQSLQVQVGNRGTAHDITHLTYSLPGKFFLRYCRYHAVLL